MRTLLLGLLLGTLAIETSGHVGTGIDVDAAGNVYVTDTIKERILRVRPDGSVTVLAAHKHSNIVVCGVDGFVYFADHGSVWRVMPGAAARQLYKSSEIRLKGRLQAGATRGGNLDEPLTIDRSGNAYFVSGNRILRVSPERKVTEFGRKPAATLLTAGFFAPDGSLYVRADGQIQRLERSGRLTRIAGGNAAGASEARDKDVWRRRTVGLAVDAARNVYVAAYRFGKVYRITPRGQAKVIYEAPFPWRPTGVSVRGSSIHLLERPGDPYGVTDVVARKVGKVRVRRLSSDGEVVTIASRPLLSKLRHRGTRFCYTVKKLCAHYVVRMMWS